MRSTTLRRTAAGATAAALAFAGLSLVTATPALAATSQVSVVHGIPGTPVDVYVNGEKTIENFEPGKVAGPLSLEEGSYDIALTKPGEEVKTGEPLCIVEAMKMENVLRAERDGTIAKIHAKEGDSLAVDAVILEFA